MKLRLTPSMNNPLVKKCLVLLLIGQCILISSCAPTTAQVRYRIHHTVLENQELNLPKKVILLPVNIPVLQISKGPVVDQLVSRSKQVNRLVTQKIRSYVKRQGKFKLLKRPNFSKRELANIKEHIVLYDLVSRNAVNYTSGARLEEWNAKLKHFDYSIGSGLNFIKRKTTAQAALIVTGVEILVDSKITGLSTKTYLIMGLVDLNSGAILWLDYVLNTKREFNQRNQISFLIESMLNNYPGLAAYRRALK